MKEDIMKLQIIRRRWYWKDDTRAGAGNKFHNLSRNNNKIIAYFSVFRKFTLLTLAGVNIMPGLLHLDVIGEVGSIILSGIDCSYCP